MMNNVTLYPAHSDAQVANAANAYLLSDLKSFIPQYQYEVDMRTLTRI